MSEHPIASEIVSILELNNYWHESFSHPPVRTSEEAAKLRPEYSLAQGAKSIILRVKVSGEPKKFLMLVLPGDKKFNTQKTKEVLNSRDIRFASEEEVDKITKSVKPGGVPPFGNLFNLQVVADQSLFNEEKMIFNAGRNFSIAMKSKDFNKLVVSKIANFCD